MDEICIFFFVQRRSRRMRQMNQFKSKSNSSRIDFIVVHHEHVCFCARDIIVTRLALPFDAA